MKIAYLILCHTDPMHIRRLTEKITHGTDDEVYIHVDRKYDIAPFQDTLGHLPRVHLIENRVAVNWGGYSSINATINLIKAANIGGGYDRVVILQGLEYPIRTNSKIHEFFEKNADKEFIRAQNISESANPKERHKYSLYWSLDNKNIWAKLIRRINMKLFLGRGVIPAFKKDYVLDNAGRRLQIYQGCAQFSVTRELAKYIEEFHDQNPMFNRYFKSMYAPDEAYFHTIVYNSPFVKKTTDGKAVAEAHLTELENLTYFEYPKLVTLFTKKEDWPRLRDSGYLFFRKASSESKELLDYIDEQHNLKEGGI